MAQWFASHCDERAWLYKKLDSTLRGNAAAELTAVERALCAAGRCPSRVVIAPAFPALGRTTVDGRQRWDGEAVDVAQLLGDPEDGRVERVVVDARRREDLDALAGSARGAARAAAAGRLGRAGGSARRPPARTVAVARPRRARAGPVLVVSGSRTPLAARQADVLCRARPLTRVAPEDGEAAARALEAGGDVLLMAPGRAHAGRGRLARPRGGTRRSGRPCPGWSSPSEATPPTPLCAALGVEALWAEREAAPGAPLLRGTLADGRALRLVMKSGSFGDDDVLARLVASA